MYRRNSEILLVSTDFISFLWKTPICILEIILGLLEIMYIHVCVCV